MRPLSPASRGAEEEGVGEGVEEAASRMGFSPISEGATWNPCLFDCILNLLLFMYLAVPNA